VYVVTSFISGPYPRLLEVKVFTKHKEADKARIAMLKALDIKYDKWEDEPRENMNYKVLISNVVTDIDVETQVPSQMGNICPNCLYVHKPYEGTSVFDGKKCEFACIKCGKQYFWYIIKEPKTDTYMGKHITKTQYEAIKNAYAALPQ